MLQIFECAFLRRRRMAQNGAFFWRCFSEFFRKWSSSAVFPHAVSQVRGQLPHKSGDNPLPCAIFVVPLHRNSKSPHAHRTFIALSPHTRIRVAAMRRSSSAKARSSSLRLFQEPFGRSSSLRCSKRFQMVQMVPEDNGTQIISAANKQYKGRGEPCGRSKR